jgi:hypothetical protein
MKKTADWFEILIENMAEKNNMMSRYLMILLVLFIGAGSLYLLLNTNG